MELEDILQLDSKYENPPKRPQGSRGLDGKIPHSVRLQRCVHVGEGLKMTGHVDLDMVTVKLQCYPLDSVRQVVPFHVVGQQAPRLVHLFEGLAHLGLVQ